MAVLDRSNKQKIYSQSIISVVFFGLVIYVLTVISAATNLSSAGGTKKGSILGLNIFEMTKISDGSGGFTGSFRFINSGAILFLVSCVVLGIILAMYRSRKAK